jgi:uncharacterized protein (DUF2225 family)
VFLNHLGFFNSNQATDIDIFAQKKEEMAACPVCGQNFKQSEVEDHLLAHGLQE